MFLKRLWLIFAQTVTVSVAALFVVQTLKPEWLAWRPVTVIGRPQVVAIQQAAEPRHSPGQVLEPGRRLPDFYAQPGSDQEDFATWLDIQKLPESFGDDQSAPLAQLHTAVAGGEQSAQQLHLPYSAR